MSPLILSHVQRARTHSAIRSFRSVLTSTGCVRAVLLQVNLLLPLVDGTETLALCLGLLPESLLESLFLLFLNLIREHNRWDRLPSWLAMFLVLVVTAELREFLVRARGGAVRLIQVRIQDGEWSWPERRARFKKGWLMFLIIYGTKTNLSYLTNTMYICDDGVFDCVGEWWMTFDLFSMTVCYDR